VVREFGYARDIIGAAGVPQGSFTYHFRSKEAFCLEVFDIYAAQLHRMLDETLLKRDLAPLARLEAYFNACIRSINRSGLGKGCLLGNFSVEASEHSESIRQRLLEAFAHLQTSVSACLQEAVERGDIPANCACDDLAALVIATMEGAALRMRVDPDCVYLDKLEGLLMQTVRGYAGERDGGRF
jgi:TetR/AcrR family transcriptional regulator, transcriptional repressor for nem operon